MNRLWSVARPLEEGSLVVLLFLLPFSKAIVAIAFFLLLIGWLLERCNPRTRAQTIWLSLRLRPLLFVAGLYLTICALSILVSDVPRLSVVGFAGKWLKFLLLFAMVADVSSRADVAQRGCWVLAVSSLCVAGLAIAQEVSIHGHNAPHPAYSFQRMTGPYENPADLGTYLMVLVPVLLGFLATQHGLRRIGLLGLVLMLVGCLGRTKSMGALAGFGIGLLVIIGTDARIRRAGLLVLAVSLVIGWAFLQQGGLWKQKMSLSLSYVGKSDRIAMWQAALDMIRDRPTLGHGVNTFMANYLNYWVGGEKMPRYAHNCFLQVAAETGLLGLATFLGLLGAITRLWWQAIEVLRAQPIARSLLVGCGAGLVGFVTQSAVDTNFYSLRQAALFWTLSGVTVGLSVKALQQHTRSPDLA